jgi:small GTP-binding protein
MASARRWQFKICLIGDGYVGKTSIRRKYLGQGFRSNYIPSLGVDFAQKTVVYDDDETVRLVIWDIAGQPQFQSLRRRYYEGCSGLILVYSVVDKEAFDNCSKWLVEAKGFMDKFPALIIVGNKIDLRPYHPKDAIISYEEGLEFAKKFSERLDTPAIFIETSALTGENIDRAFEQLTRMMINPQDRQTVTTMHEVHMDTLEESRPPDSSPFASATSAPEIKEESRPSVSSSFASTTSAPEIKEESRPSVSSSFASTTSAPEIKEESRPPDSSPFASATSAPETEEEQEPVGEVILPQEDEVALKMTELIELRAKLKKAEEEFRDYSLEVETKLLNLRNTVHVKKIMYEHLRQQLAQTRQEWADSYDEHVQLDQKKKSEVENRLANIENLRKRIDAIESSVRKKVHELDLERMRE